MIVASYAGYAATPARPRATLHRVRNDRDRINLIWNQAWKGVQDPETRASAIAKVSRCASRDDRCELNQLFKHQIQNIKYMADVTDVDTYASPQRTKAWGAGDCDDHVSAMMADGTSIGFRMGARVIPATEDHEGHIMALAGLPKNNPKEAIVLDTTVPGAYPGWQPPRRKMKGWQDYWFVVDDDGAKVQLGDSDATAGRPTWVPVVLIVASAISLGVLIDLARRASR